MEKKVNTRELIVDMLVEIYGQKEYSHILIRNVLDKYDYLEESDKAFIKRVTEGTLERGIQIDYILNSFSKVPVNKMKPLIRSLMRMSVYQILFMDKVPDSAVCNEAVKLAEKRKFGPLKGFVNGVLRTISRQKESISYPNREKQPKEFFSVTYSMPVFLTELLMKEYGAVKTEEILQGMLGERNLCIRMQETLSKEQKQEVTAEWEKKGVLYEKHPWLPYACLLKNTERLSSLTGFSKGFYTVQDISSMLVCEIAGIEENSRVLDVCAAPGGKSLHAACKLNGTGLVEARDVSDYKINLIQENIERLHMENIQTKLFDATLRDESAIASADVVLLDIPCSGIGVIGKKPDIKYHITEESLQSLEKLQKKIADTVWEYVKPGKTLIYSTCTIRRAENQEMVEYLTKNYPFETESLDEYLPEALRNEDTRRGQLLLLPSKQSDGFFIARLRRKK